MVGQRYIGGDGGAPALQATSCPCRGINRGWKGSSTSVATLPARFLRLPGGAAAACICRMRVENLQG
eukprot:13325734-Alexandrium_andersonii.AAC.1